MSDQSRAMTRREIFRLGAAAGTLLVCRPSSLVSGLGSRKLLTGDVSDVDHLLWGVSDRDHGMDTIEEKTGIRAVVGGAHPNRGTRNALISLGERHYLEILAPDPAQSQVQEGRVTVVRGLTKPRILTWAARTNDIEETEKRLLAAGYETSGVNDGARNKPDGTVLHWRSLSVNGHDGDVIPFVIEWSKDTTHPSEDSPKGCILRELRLER